MLERRKAAQIQAVIEKAVEILQPTNCDGCSFKGQCVADLGSSSTCVEYLTAQVVKQILK